jgi:predicted Fe-Mo cluster-binding NifX family protein
MKVAVVTDDGKTISSHFGRAKYYLVYDIQDKKVQKIETRPKVGRHLEGLSHHDDSSARSHDHGSGETALHNSMLSNVLDCEALIAGGMGSGAYMSIEEAGITPFLTDKIYADEAVQAYLNGTLNNQVERLH